MKIISVLGLLSVCSVLGAQTVNQATPAANSTAVPVPTPYAVVSQDANSAVWQQETYERVPDGSIVTNVHTYTELATGLNHLVNGQWVASKEDIDISPDGSSASATNGQHQVYFPGDIYNGVIQLITPDGKQLTSQPIGLSYFDGTNSVLLAELTNSTGQILPSGNQVIYTNAFDGLNADLLYTYTKAGFEQDVILREQPPDPDSLGLNPAATRLQVLTEFFNPPQPSVTATTVSTAAGYLEDDNLSFGAMQMGPGKAFLIGGNSPSVEVNKQWMVLNGRQFLVEEVPLISIAQAIDTLPAFISQAGVGIHPVASKNLILPPQRLVQRRPKTKFLAQATPSSTGFVLDYVAMTSQTNWTFQGDTTYYISGTVNLSGTNAFEGDAVLKYTNGASVNLGTGTGLNWEASAYRPVIITSWNDNSVGDSISGSTGNPTNYCANPALNFNSTSAFTISCFRIAWAAQAIGDYGSQLNFHDGQLVDCQNGISDQYGHLSIENVLFAGVQTNFNYLEDLGSALSLQNVTLCNSVLAGDIVGTGFYFTNCILANVNTSVTNGGLSLSGCSNGFYNTPEFGTGPVTNTFNPFQTVGAGSFYLTNGCNFFNQGSTNIDPTLLADLQHKTTYPPLLLTNQTIAVNTTLNPQAQRDTASPGPDLGYHYDPIDYIADEFALTNAILMVTNGTTIASYNETGIQLQDGSSIVSIGNPVYPNWFVRYSSVQEQPMELGGTNLTSGLTVSALHYGNVGPTGQYRFSKFACPAGCGYLFDDAGASSYSNLLVKDCELYSGLSYFGGYSNTVTALLNNLFDRSYLYAYDNATPNSLSVSNNLVFGTTVYLFNWSGANIWRAFNNAFDTCLIYYAPYPPIGQLTNGYNAYLHCSGYSGQMGQLSPTNVFDIVTNASLAYQIGPLGAFYQPTNSLLINMGSTTANLVGLYHYTVTTNLISGQEVPEGTNIVSIGYHYVAVDTNGVPISTSGDGIGDYLKDSNGDGVYDAGDLGNWLSADTCGDGISDYIKWLEGRNLNVVAVIDTNSVVQFSVYTPLK